MNLNRYRSHSKKYTYDGYRIIKKGAQELYSFVYERIWDLTQYDKDTLAKYGLSKAKYIYVGSSNIYNLNTRSSKWKNEISNNTKCVAKDIREFINNLKLFYMIETDYTATEIDFLLYYNANVVARAESLEGARALEKAYTTRYHNLDFYGDILETHYILLSKVDSNLKEVCKAGVKVLKYR